MRLSIRNFPKHLDLKKFKLAVNYYSKILLPKGYVNLNLRIIFKDLTKEKIDGSSAIPYEDEFYEIEIEQGNSVNIIYRILAHELTHVKQFYKKELKDLNNSTKWKQKHYKSKSVEDLLNDDYKTYKEYSLSPWELEAFGYEEILFNLFKRRYNLRLKDLKRA